MKRLKGFVIFFLNILGVLLLILILEIKFLATDLCKKDFLSLPLFSVPWGELACSSPVSYTELNRFVTCGKLYAKSMLISVLSNHQQQSK